MERLGNYIMITQNAATRNGRPEQGRNLLAALDELKAKVGIPLSIICLHAWNGTRADLKDQERRR